MTAAETPTPDGGARIAAMSVRCRMVSTVLPVQNSAGRVGLQLLDELAEAERAGLTVHE